ncbi:MAG TPA: hypothetical protein VLK25_10775 [Allosphingosinicella sp.]|nr:hypothetical protein [Allosphingosinicella sp.]
MARPVRLIAAFLFLSLPLVPAHAYCEYRGVVNARTTLAQEFRDSRWVVRVRVLSARDNWADVEGPWTIYRLQVLHGYKGRVPRRISFFTERNSGGFYMDRASSGPTQHDIGGEYLLFLSPIRPRRGYRMFVNYPCGQSRPWAEVGVGDRRRLAALSGR